MAKELEIDRLFPKEKMEILANGMAQLEENLSFDFLATLFGEGNFTREDLLLAVKPVTISGLLYAEHTKSKEWQMLKKLWCHQLFQDESHFNDWPFVFSIACHSGCFGSDLKKVLKGFDTLCRGCRKHLPYMDTGAKQRLDMLRQEVLQLDLEDDCWYFDMHSKPKKPIVIPALSPEKIERLMEMGADLQTSRNARYLVQSTSQAAEVLRFVDCVRLKVKGYECISQDIADALILKTNLLFDLKSNFIITKWFLSLCCCDDETISPLTFFLIHGKTLLRPLNYGTPFYQRNKIQDYCSFVTTPSRLCYGIAESLKYGNFSILDRFLSDDEAGPFVNNKRFVKDLVFLLGCSTKLHVAAELYAKHHSKYTFIIRQQIRNAGFLQDEPIPEHTPGYLTEQHIIEHTLGSFPMYYDDRGLLLQAIDQPMVDWMQILNIYDSDIEIAKACIARDRSAIDLLSPAIKNNPDIQQLIRKETDND